MKIKVCFGEKLEREVRSGDRMVFIPVYVKVGEAINQPVFKLQLLDEHTYRLTHLNGWYCFGDVTVNVPRACHGKRDAYLKSELVFNEKFREKVEEKLRNNDYADLWLERLQPYATGAYEWDVPAFLQFEVSTAVTLRDERIADDGTLPTGSALLDTSTGVTVRHGENGETLVRFLHGRVNSASGLFAYDPTLKKVDNMDDMVAIYGRKLEIIPQDYCGGVFPAAVEFIRKEADARRQENRAEVLGLPFSLFDEGHLDTSRVMERVFDCDARFPLLYYRMREV